MCKICIGNGFCSELTKEDLESKRMGGLSLLQ